MISRVSFKMLFCPPSPLDPTLSPQVWESTVLLQEVALAGGVSPLSPFLCRRAFPGDSAILIRLVIHLRARAK